MDDLVASMTKAQDQHQIRGNKSHQHDQSSRSYTWGWTPHGNDTSRTYVPTRHVRKVQHIARLTLNLPTGPVEPTYIELLALELSDCLGGFSVDQTRVQERAVFADEIDFVCRVPHSRHHQNIGSASNHHVLSALRVPSMAN